MRNKINKYIGVGLLGLSLLGNGVTAAPSADHLRVNHGEASPLAIKNVWSPLGVSDTSGLLGERLYLYRDVRMPWMLDSGWMLLGFEKRPGPHTWMGEHFGKWLHVATLEYLREPDPELKQIMEGRIDRLLATQLENGYLGTYVGDRRFDNAPNKGNAWDIWVHRYNLYGLLFYERHFENPEILAACIKMGDLLIDSYGAGTGNDITQSGTRHGMSSATVLESMMMLYARTGDSKYLDFSLHIVDQCEANPGHRLLSTMLEKGELYKPGDGKAYQIMANLFGYLLIYRATEDARYLDSVTYAWQKIKDQHLTVTGGPWSRKIREETTQECFKPPSDFHPSELKVEGCSDTSWIQLNIHLYELTGDTKYMNEAELCVFNDSLAHQARDGVDYCYYTNPNQEEPPYHDWKSCCASSIPRGHAMYASRMLGTTEGRLVINSLSPFTGSLGNSFGQGHIRVKSEFPYGQTATIKFSDNQAKQFDCEIRLPMNTNLKSMTLNGKEIAATLNEQGNPVISNTWKSGDVLTVEMEFLLKADVTKGDSDKSWVAFTYGPVVLAQKLEKDATQEEPFLGKSFDLSTLEEMLTQSADHTIDFAVNDSDVTLIPYVDAMIENMTIVTYFKLD
jgi:DUF1680 family protein